METGNNLYILKERDGLLATAKSWRQLYDSCQGVVVRAPNEATARMLVSATCHGDEGSNVWLDKDYTTCTLLTNEGEQGVVIVDFLNG